MDDLPLRPTLRTILMVFVTIAALGLMMTPIRPGPAGGAMPDLVFCLVVYWVLRRPSQVPLLVVFGLGLTADLLLGRPVGVGALALLLISELLRSQAQALRDLHFVFEWLVVTLLLISATFFQSLILWITLAPSPGLGAMIGASFSTSLAYPVVVLFGRYILHLRYTKRRFMVTPLGEEQVQ